MAGAAPHGAAAGGARDRATAWAEGVHDFLCALFERLDGEAKFREDRWDREGGGGGVARVMTDGAVFEKAGINRSIVMGTLPPQAAQRLGGRGAAAGSTDFFAAGVSLVVHPRSPRVPTVHLNVRYFELTDAQGNRTDHWFGGGTDLTPTYPHAADAAHFHRTLKQICDAHHPSFFGRFKPWCDEYFTIPHRNGEARGVGGVFFDHLRPDEDESGLGLDGMFAYATAIGQSLAEAYGPIVERRKGEASNERERHLQLWRRGRYVEFNLVYDRGTHFGLHTNARVESVLMSLPPIAGWEYNPQWEVGSIEFELVEMLKPRDWAGSGL